MRQMQTSLLTFLTVIFMLFRVGFANTDHYDIVIYGGTSAGVIAAVQASKMGRSVALIEPSRHLGGMTSNGLGRTDIGKTDAIGGLTREFLHHVWEHYQAPGSWVYEPDPMRESFRHFHPKSKLMWVFEPHVAENIFDSMLAATNVAVILGERLNRETGVSKTDQRIKQITTESGRVFQGNIFIDATYEGDLMASAGVSYRVGREPNDEYGEKMNGIRRNLNRKDMPAKIDPYVTAGDPASGLLPRISSPIQGAEGDGDLLIQAYNYRMCLTNVPQNRVLVEKPSGYDQRQYEIVFRAIKAGMARQKFFKLDSVPNGKTDSNNFSAISTDFIGMSSDYVEADYRTRESIAREHEKWQRGLIWTLQNHPRTDPKVKQYYAGWGLPKDEFVDNNHWPHQLYVREARRMVGEKVITEHTALRQDPDPDSVGLGSYSLDSHAVQYFVAPDGFLATEGEMWEKIPAPYPISYRAIVPKSKEVTNLLVPVCLSATHAAYGSIRMEPVFMILGQSAATAASLAIENNVDVQKVDYSLLKQRLLADGQVLN